MKEIRRNANSTMNEGIACGPISVYAIDAEIVVEDEGRNVYLHTQWVDAVGDEILFEATTQSVYELELAISRVEELGGDAFNEAILRRDRVRQESDISAQTDIGARYHEQYEQLLGMMQEVLDRDEIGIDLREQLGGDEDYEDEDWDEDEENC